MRAFTFLLVLSITIFSQCHSPETKLTSYTTASQIESGKAVSVMLTSYSTTLIANGTDQTRLRIAITDSISREITSADDTIHLYVTGNGKVTSIDGTNLQFQTDTAGFEYSICTMLDGSCQLLFIAGTEPGKIKVEARSGKLWAGSHEIHMLPANFVKLKPEKDQLQATNKEIGKMIGADISWLPQLEGPWNRKFIENGEERDAIELLKDHGFNYIRLRIFVNPENEKGYSPVEGYCGLNYTLDMAKRVKSAGLKLLLDFHYSDYWADPQQQYKPLRWAELDFETLKDSVKTYTSYVLSKLKKQGTFPDMVQIGNEINHGILWPDGHIGNPDQLAELLKAGVEGVINIDPELPVMMHIALGGQNEEAVFWLDNMIARGVQFDIIGISFYPRWHGTLDDLNFNLHDLVKRYNKPLNVVEYNDFKREVHEIVFNLPDEMGKGACIWEPLNWRSGLFTNNGEVTDLFSLYNEIEIQHLKSQ